jgi:hypothetical protein
MASGKSAGDIFIKVLCYFRNNESCRNYGLETNRVNVSVFNSRSHPVSGEQGDGGGKTPGMDSLIFNGRLSVLTGPPSIIGSGAIIDSKSSASVVFSIGCLYQRLKQVRRTAAHTGAARRLDSQEKAETRQRRPRRSWRSDA